MADFAEELVTLETFIACLMNSSFEIVPSLSGSYFASAPKKTEILEELIVFPKKAQSFAARLKICLQNKGHKSSKFWVMPKTDLVSKYAQHKAFYLLSTTSLVTA